MGKFPKQARGYIQYTAKSWVQYESQCVRQKHARCSKLGQMQKTELISTVVFLHLCFVHIVHVHKVTQCTFKVQIKVMLAPANYFLHQKLCLVYRPIKKFHSAPLKFILESQVHCLHTFNIIVDVEAYFPFRLRIYLPVFFCTENFNLTMMKWMKYWILVIIVIIVKNEILISC